MSWEKGRNQPKVLFRGTKPSCLHVHVQPGSRDFKLDSRIETSFVAHSPYPHISEIRATTSSWGKELETMCLNPELSEIHDNAGL